MIYFVSDIHLGYHTRQQDKILEKNFVDWLRSLEDCEVLVLLGDIFDYWFEYKYVIAKYYYRTLAALADLVDKGVKIEYLMGNHDFGHKTFFINELGIELITEDVEREYYGKRFYLSHGDGKSNNDKGYLILRKILRNRTCQNLYSLIHPDIGIPLAWKSSESSRKYTKSKDYGEKDGMRDFAEGKIGEGFDYVVMGHRHIEEQTVFEVNGNKGEYINLGSWLDDKYFGRFDGKDMKLICI